VKYFIAGGAGFIGSELAHKILERGDGSKVVIYDNFSTGKKEFLADIMGNPNLEITIGDIKNIEFLTFTMHGCDAVYHFASNADISKAMSDPTIDFWEGTYLTQNILEAMRINKIKKIVYASGSGVYGNHLFESITEDTSPMLPNSTYGASKMAGEALISAYCNMFDMKARVYRFANVIGKNQTHGVISDLITKLKKNPKKLTVLGSGRQSKTYMHVSDILNAIYLTEGGDKEYEYYNVSSETNIDVKNIVHIILEEMNLAGKTKIIYGDTDAGWKGDIPFVYMNADKLTAEGWHYVYASRQAVRKTIKDILNKER